MYGSYSRFISQQSADSTRKAIESVIAARAKALVESIRRNGGRLTHAQAAGQFGEDAIAHAVEHTRSAYAVTQEVDGKTVVYYVAN